MHTSKALARGFQIIAIALFAFLLISCGGGATSQISSGTSKAPAEQQILVTQITGLSDIKTFDPALATDGLSLFAVKMVFTGLIQLNDNRQIRDQIAASHSVAPDGVTYTFKLKPNLKFSDGTPLTSADIAYSINRALQPGLKSVVAPAYLNLIKDADKLNEGKINTIIGDSILTPDPQTIIIITKSKAAYFLDAFTYACSYVVEKSMIDKYGNNFADHLSEGIGGAGPFKVARYIHGKEIDFVPNPYYYGTKPQLKKVIITFFQTTDTAYKAYEANQIDTAIVPPEQTASAQALPDGQFRRISSLGIYYYTMNYLAKPFDNIKIRQAFALAINKDEIAHDIHKDTLIATNHIVPEGQPGYYQDLTGPLDIKGTRGDPALAKQLFQEGLKEEGYTISTLPPITFTVSSQGMSDFSNEFAAAQQMWQNTLGVSVKINDIDFNKLLDEVEAATNNPKGLQLWALEWGADYPDPQDWLTLQFDKGTQNNNSNYGQNSSADAAQQQATQQLMEQADVNQNPAERMLQYNKAEQQLVNDVVWLPITQATDSIVIKPCVANVVKTATVYSTPPDDWGSIYITTGSPCANTSQYQ